MSLQLMSEERHGAPQRAVAYQRRATEDAAFDALAAATGHGSR